MLLNMVHLFLLTYNTLFHFLVTNIKYQVAAKVICILNVLCLIPFHYILSVSLDINLFLIALTMKKYLFIRVLRFVLLFSLGMSHITMSTL